MSYIAFFSMSVYTWQILALQIIHLQKDLHLVIMPYASYGLINGEFKKKPNNYVKK